MDLAESELRAAREALGWEAEGQSPGTASPADAAQFAQMQETIGALQAWRASLEELPPPAISHSTEVASAAAVPFPRVPGDWRLWSGGIALAASALVAVTLWSVNQLAAPQQVALERAVPPPQVAVGNPVEAELDSRWIALAPAWPVGKGGAPPEFEGGVGNPPPKVDKGSQPGGVTDGGPPKGTLPKKAPDGSIRPGGVIRGGTKSGGASTDGSKFGGSTGGLGGATTVREPADLAQLGFTCRTPAELPGGWKLSGTRSVGPNLQLRYLRNGETLIVSVWSERGPDVAPHPIDLGAGRQGLATVRGELAVVYDGPINADQAAEFAPAFQPVAP